MNIINKIIKYGRDKKEQKEIDFIISLLYRRIFILSNLDQKTFHDIINNFLKEYDNLRFLADNNILFILENGKYRKLTRKEKLKFLFQDR